jgi:hypothetical protein
MIYKYTALLTVRKENAIGVPAITKITYFSDYHSIDVMDEILHKEAIVKAQILGYETFVVHSVSIVKDSYLPSSVVVH